MPRLIVLDCDGFLTDAGREGAPFVDAYVRNLTILVGRATDEIYRMVNECEAEVRAHPEKHGYKDQKGRIVAPAMADPYLRMGPVAEMIFDRCKTFKRRDERKRLMELLFLRSYEHTKIIFRRRTRRTLKVLEGTDTHIVTNSATDAVQKKIKRAGADWLLDRVHGLARKFMLVDEWDLVPETMELPGLKRPVYLRRMWYFGLLDTLCTRAEVEWKDVLVCGDIFELDLALPLILGATVALLPNENTPRYEVDFVRSHPRGHVLTSIADILPLVGIA